MDCALSKINSGKQGFLRVLLGLQFRLAKLIVPSDARIGYTLSNFSTRLLPFSNVLDVTPVPGAPTSANSPFLVVETLS